MPCKVQEKNPLPPRRKQRLNGVSAAGGVMTPGATAAQHLDVEDFGLQCDPDHQSVPGPAAPAANDDVQCRARPGHWQVSQLARISRIGDFAVLRAKVDGIVRGECSAQDQIAGNVGMLGIYTRIQNGNLHSFALRDVPCAVGATCDTSTLCSDAFHGPLLWAARIKEVRG